jgi:hypothetical protein
LWETFTHFLLLGCVLSLYLMAISATGQLYMWGAGLQGQLGTGEERLRWRSLRPKLIPTPNNVTFKTLVVGFECSLAITCTFSITVSYYYKCSVCFSLFIDLRAWQVLIFQSILHI